MFERILVPVDLTEKNRHAVEVARDLADPFREAGTKIREQVVYGDRAREIVSYASEEDYGLLVMTSRRIDPEDSDISPRNWPTISHKVAIMADVPVLLVR